ncbi:hypothetical protein ACYE2N_00790 [Flavobacterium sp. MAHUQ-51]|uniref:hypothetical protein n=1 Tax=Flavobacterium sp. GCM10022190 TaxID=3252639 RepID=UPI00361025B3
MKKIIGILGVAVIAGAMFLGNSINVTNNQGNDFLLKNVIAMSQAQAEGGSTSDWPCYSRVDDCYIFGCWTAYLCGNPCTTVSVDDVFGIAGNCHAQ